MINNTRSLLPRSLVRQTSIASIALTLTLFNASFSHAQQNQAAQKLVPIIMSLLDSENVVGSEMPVEDASRFLIQSTFGPTYNDIAQLSNSSFESWLNRQFILRPTHTVAYAESQNWIENYPLIRAGAARSSLINVMLRAPDQLRQRMAYALSQIFVVSRDVSNGIDERPLLYLDYYDLLADNAFGNYRDLLEKVTLNSVMAFYLSMTLNAPAGTQVGPVNHPASFFVTSPDENYAREVMQLFSIGLVKLNIDGTPMIENGEAVPSYTQETVENFARVFTGWNYQSDNGNAFFNLGVPQDPRPIISFDAFHDKGEKTLLEDKNGILEVLPANQTAVEDLDDALDNIFNHPNVGPFIGKLLIQHFVTSNPTPAYVERVARVFNDNGAGVRGDLKAVISAILLDTEARNGHETLPEQFGKFKEPYIRMLAMWRGMGARRRTNNNNLFDAYDDIFLERFNQVPLEARSVFNFYQADFSPSGVLSANNLLAPEGQLLDSESVIGISTTFEEYIQRHHDDAGNDFATSPTDLLINTRPLQALLENDLQDRDALIERLNLVFLGGAMSDEMRQILRDVHDPAFYLVEDKWKVVIDLLNIIILSPQSWVQK